MKIEKICCRQKPESHIPQYLLLVLLSRRKCALEASKDSREGRGKPPESHRKTQKECFSHHLAVGFQRQGVAVNQGTAEEKRLSEMILLSGSRRVSFGLEILFIKGATDNFSS